MRYKYVRYVTMNEVLKWIYKGLEKLDGEFDYVVGVGRSGAFLGGLIAMKMNVRFYYFDEYSEEKGIVVGKRILVVDDVVRTGRTIRKVLRNIEANEIVIFTLVYSESSNLKNVIYIKNDSGGIWYLFEWDTDDLVRGRVTKWGR